MTVAELIEKLQAQRPDAHVYIQNSEWGNLEAVNVEIDVDGDVIIGEA